MSNNGSVSRADHQKVVEELASAKAGLRFCRTGSIGAIRELKENLAAARAGLTHGARKIIELHATRAARCETELERTNKFWHSTSAGWVKERNSLMEASAGWEKERNSLMEQVRGWSRLHDKVDHELRTCQQRLEECQQRLARARAPVAGGARRTRRRRKNKKRRRTRRR